MKRKIRRAIKIGEMVEVQNININSLTVGNDGFKNEIILSPTKQFNSKSLASESELHRILIHLSGEERNESGYKIVPSYFTLNVGGNKRRYQKLIQSNGELILGESKYVLDENGDKVLGEIDEEGKRHYQVIEGEKHKYLSTFCGAGHSRTQKNLFVEETVVDKLNDIILCGIPKDLVYDRPSKWNAYYSMVCTDSTPVSYTPNIVVIQDYKKQIRQKVDIVEVSGSGENKVYNTIGHKGIKHHKETIEILPFDGAGLVTPQCALKWARELGCKSQKGKFYLPSCFQFRAIPGIKGEVMVFDLKKFAREHKVSKITDLGGKEWDLFKDKVDVILTQSQFKFWNLYMTDGKFDYSLWRNEFDKGCHGYKRTFNIVSYAVHPGDLREKTMLSYQPEQTVNFTEDEIASIGSMGLKIYQDVTSDVSKFLKYRGLITRTDNAGNEIVETDTYIPPFYKALRENPNLYYDKYIRSKVDEDIRKLRNNLLAGKVFVRGNYQVFMPDLFGLAEWAFHHELGREPKGLLKKPYYVYSDWWNERCVSKVDIIRNPAVGMEHRIGHVRNNKDLKKWFKYQSTGIVTGMYDTLALALGTADFDGDTVCTTDNQPLIQAVIREFKAGNGRVVLKKELDKTKSKTNAVQISDRASLMRVNEMSFSNSIGMVIDRITDLWSMVHLKSVSEDTVRNYIMTGVIVGGETIDFAKTGESAEFPSEIIHFMKKRKKGYWMRYLEKHLSRAAQEEQAVAKAKFFDKSNEEIERLRKFDDYDCNMNCLCHYAEKQIKMIDSGNSSKQCELEFDHRTLLRSTPPISRKVYRRLQTLQNECQILSDDWRKVISKSKTIEKDKHNQYRWFYDRCRTELLFLVPNINKLLDMLIMIYYGDKHKGSEFISLEKDILWNAFSDEMIQRCCNSESIADINMEKLKKRHAKNVRYSKDKKEKYSNSSKVQVKSFNIYENIACVLTIGDRKKIAAVIDEAYKNKLVRKCNVIKVKRILALLIYFSRKTENERTVERVIKENGRLIKDEKGVNIRKTIVEYMPRWMKLYNNTPDELTGLAIEKMVDVNHKYVLPAIKILEQLNIVSTKLCPDGSTNIKVFFAHHDGAAWIEEADYNKASTMIKTYFKEL